MEGGEKSENMEQEASSSAPSFGGDNLQAARKIIESYHRQVTAGCGSADCENPDCVSSGKVEPIEDANAAAAKAIALACNHKDKRICKQTTAKVETPPTRKKSSSEASHCRHLSRAALAETPPDQLEAYLRTVFSSPGLLSRSFPSEEAVGAPISLDLPELRAVFKELFAEEPPFLRCALFESVAALSSSLIARSRNSDRLWKDNPRLLNAVVLVLELPVLEDMGFQATAFPLLMRVVGALPDLAKVHLIKFWSGQGAAWLQDRLESVQQLLTIHLLQSEYSRHAAVQTDKAVVHAVKFLHLIYLASLYGGDRDSVATLKAEAEFYAPADADVDAFFRNAREMEPEGGHYMALLDTEDKWITGTEGGLQRLLGVRRVDVHVPLVPYTEFYNETLSELIEPDRDFLNFKNLQENGGGEEEEGRFSFLSHAFVLQPQIRMDEMFYDNRILMNKHRRRAAFQAHFIGVALESPFLTISVSRENAVRDALGQLELIMGEAPRDLKKQLRVIFQGEPGVDEGGPSKEFYQIITELLFNPDYGMFTHNEQTGRFWFRPGAAVDTEAEFTLIGALFGLAIYNSLIVEVAFPPALYLKLLGKIPGFRYLGGLDPTLAASLQQMLDYAGEDFEDVFCASFEISFQDVFGETRTEALVPGGKDKPVTKDNRQDYVSLYADFLLNGSVAGEFAAFRKGFRIVTHESCLASLFGPEEIEMLVCGTPAAARKALLRATTDEPNPDMQAGEVALGLPEIRKKANLTVADEKGLLAELLLQADPNAKLTKRGLVPLSDESVTAKLLHL